MKNKTPYIIGILLFVLAGCSSSDYTPKPRAYLRIDLPEKSYQHLQSDTLPYFFEYPEYSEVVSAPKTNNPNSKYWVNLDFPSLNGTIHLTYNRLDSAQQLYAYVDSSYQAMFTIHKDKITGINERAYEDMENQVYGTLYELRGTRVASPYQFYITDKKEHFVRGALYFNMQPNNDSLAPVIDYVKKDIEHLMSTLRWITVSDKKTFNEYQQKVFIK